MKGFKIIILFFVLTALISCSSNQHFYKGDRLPVDQLATLYGSNIYINKINGISVDTFYLVELAYAKPGPSEIEVSYTFSVIGNRISYVEKTLSMNLELGGVYYLDFVEGSLSTFRVFYLGKSYDFLTEGHYTEYNSLEIRDRVEMHGQRIL